MIDVSARFDDKFGLNEYNIQYIQKQRLGGIDIAVLDCRQTAELIVRAALERQGRGRPLMLSSANGEVISRCRRDPELARAFAAADLVNADGQPLVFISRLCRNRLPERVATTDLFHDVAREAIRKGATFYMFGGTEAVNQEACRRAAALYPGLSIVGRSHGYLTGEKLEATIEHIKDLAPDILWVALGVPLEQQFYQQWSHRLSTVGAIKTSGGLFDFLAGVRRRAPRWMQMIGIEWAYRMMQEPGRLWWRYAVTNPHAI